MPLIRTSPARLLLPVRPAGLPTHLVAAAKSSLIVHICCTGTQYFTFWSRRIPTTESLRLRLSLPSRTPSPSPNLFPSRRLPERSSSPIPQTITPTTPLFPLPQQKRYRALQRKECTKHHQRSSRADYSSRIYPTPYVYFGGYQIESAQLITANGKVQCSTMTVSSQLSRAYGFAYQGNPSLDWAGAGERSGTIPAAFAQAAGIQSCSPGMYRGAPTLELAIATFTAVDYVSPVHAVESVGSLGPPAVTSGAMSQGAPPAAPAQTQASAPAARTSSSAAGGAPAAAVGQSSTAVPPPPQASPATAGAAPASAGQSNGAVLPSPQGAVSNNAPLPAIKSTSTSPTVTDIGNSPVNSAANSVASNAQQSQPQQQAAGTSNTAQQGSISAQTNGGPTVLVQPTEAPSANSQGGAGPPQNTPLAFSPSTRVATFTTTSGSSTIIVTQTLVQSSPGAALPASPAEATGSPITKLTTFTTTSGSSTFVTAQTIVQSGPQAAAPQVTEIHTITSSVGSSTFLVTETIVKPGTALSVNPDGLSNSLATKVTTLTETSGSSTFLVTATLLENGPQATVTGLNGPGVTELRTFMMTSGSSTFVVTNAVIASAMGASPVTTISGLSASKITEMKTFTTTSGSSTSVVTETVVVDASGGIGGAILSGMGLAPSPSSTSTVTGATPVQYQGSAAKVDERHLVWLAGGAAIGSVMGLVLL